MRTKPFPATEPRLSLSSRGPRNPGRKTQGEEWVEGRRLDESLYKVSLAFRPPLQSCTCQRITPPWQESGGLDCEAMEPERCLTRKREIHWKSTYRTKRKHTSLFTLTLSAQSPYLPARLFPSLGVKMGDFPLVKLNSLRKIT